MTQEELNEVATKENNFASRQETIRRNLECLTKIVINNGSIPVLGKTWSSKISEEFGKICSSKILEHVKALNISY